MGFHLLFKLSGAGDEKLNMKTRCVLLFLSILLGLASSHAQDNFKPFSADEELKEIIFEDEALESDAFYHTALVKEGTQRRLDIYNLQKAKFKMVNGDLKTARFLLGRIDDKAAVMTSIKNRYLATIDFIEGRYNESLKKLELPVMQTSQSYPQICLLKLINIMALDKREMLKKEARNCMALTDDFSKNDQYWLDTMLQLKLQDQTALKRKMMTDIEGTMSDDEMSRIWLKTGVYLNRQEELIGLLGILPESSYQSKRIREIIAFLYLRKGDKQKALSFIDDVDTANAENIKGTLNLANREYELAFGHFRLALQRKQDSANALERAIALAWILRQWDEGISMLASVSNKNLDPRNTKAIEIAFLIRQKKFLEAQRELTLLKIDFKQQPPFEVNIMDTYVNLIVGNKEKKYDKRKIEESAERSCKSFDGISCWLSLQYIQWENLGKTITRDDLIYSDKTLTIESLKEKKSITPLKETASIDQSDIEELDSNTIVLPK